MFLGLTFEFSPFSSLLDATHSAITSSRMAQSFCSAASSRGELVKVTQIFCCRTSCPKWTAFPRVATRREALLAEMVHREADR